MQLRLSAAVSPAGLNVDASFISLLSLSKAELAREFEIDRTNKFSLFLKIVFVQGNGF
jgi:hypothetical protein